jgi:sodium-dependent dicarboxylate transporter 2/3/5
LRKRLGFWSGPLLFAAVLFCPLPAISPEARRAAAVIAWMGVWWTTEAVELAAASLLPLALFPLLSVLTMEETARRYAEPNVFLFMGGFMLALAMQKCELHRRIALHTIRLCGTGPRRMLGGFMLATACISMWVSNTATAVMMLPIGMAVIERIESKHHRTAGFDTALMLGIAYASSIGGAATLIGTPPNLIFAGQAKELLPALPPVGFMEWFVWAFPLSAGFLVLTWAYLSFFVIRKGTRREAEDSEQVLDEEIAALGKLSEAETRVMTIFFLTVAAWIFREDIPLGALRIRGWAGLLGLKGVHDGTVAMVSALALFAIPEGRGKDGRLLNWDWAKRLPWEVLLLFGAGFAVAESFQSTGLAGSLAGGLKAFSVLPAIPLVWVLCAATTFVSEFMSNTAQVSLMMPVLAAAAPTLGIHPYLLMIPATLAASFAFMMPAGTPPNAVVIGSGRLSILQMAKAGLALNLLGSFWITLMTFTLLQWSFRAGFQP